MIEKQTGSAASGASKTETNQFAGRRNPAGGLALPSRLVEDFVRAKLEEMEQSIKG